MTMDTVLDRAVERNEVHARERGLRRNRALLKARHNSGAVTACTVIPLSRPRIERSLDCLGWYVIQDDHGWLFGSREHALNEFANLVEIGQPGSYRRAGKQ